MPRVEFSYKKFFDYIKVTFYTILVYSGILKSLPYFPFDPAIISGGVCILIVSYAIITQSKRIYLKGSIIQLFFLLLFLWAVFTSLYTPSSSYYFDKLIRIFLLLVLLVYPIYIFKKRYLFKIFQDQVTFFGVVTLLILYYIYVTSGGSLAPYFNLLSLIAANKLPSGTIVPPDYLVLGTLFGVCFFMNYSRNSLFFILLKVAIVIMLVLLGGRGPILFLILLIVGDYLWRSKDQFSIKRQTQLVVVLIAIPMLSSVFLSWKGSQRIVDRFSRVTTGKGNQSMGERQKHYSEAFHLIQSDGVLGIGIGGYGIKTINQDIRSYPHNVFLEIFVELGIVGITLLLILLLFFAYNFGFPVYSKNHLLFSNFVLVFIFLFFNAMKSSSLIDLKDLFAAMGIIVSGYYIMEQETRKKKLLG